MFGNFWSWYADNKRFKNLFQNKNGERGCLRKWELLQSKTNCLFRARISIIRIFLRKCFKQVILRNYLKLLLFVCVFELKFNSFKLIWLIFHLFDSQLELLFPWVFFSMGFFLSNLGWFFPWGLFPKPSYTNAFYNKGTRGNYDGLWK